jgi:bacterioferritin-associated ferredoxin
MYFCICKSVSDTQIRQAVEQGARTVGELSAQFGLGDQCGRCLDSIGEWLKAYLSTSAPTHEDTVTQSDPVAPVSPPASVTAAVPARAAWFTIDP